MITFLTIVLVLSIAYTLHQHSRLATANQDIRQRKQRLEEYRNRIGEQHKRIETYQEQERGWIERTEGLAMLTRAQENALGARGDKIKALEHELSETLTACRQLQAKETQGSDLVRDLQDACRQKQEIIDGDKHVFSELTAKLVDLEADTDRLRGKVTQWYKLYIAERDLNRADLKPKKPSRKPAVKPKAKRKAA